MNKRTVTIEWQPITEPPDDETTVFLAFADGETDLGFIDNKQWRLAAGFSCDPVAWAHTPEIPEEFLQ